MDNQPIQPPAPSTSTEPPKHSRKNLLVTLLFILLLAAFGVGVYFWQHQKVNDLNAKVTSLNTKVTSLDKQLASSSNKANAKETTNSMQSTSSSTDEQVITAVKNYCNANVDSTTKQSLVLTVGKAGPSQKQVLYSSDKNFAYVNAVCSKDGTTEGSGSAYYLKKVNNSWIFLYRGQMTDPEATVQFNIPNDFN